MNEITYKNIDYPIDYLKFYNLSDSLLYDM